MTDQNKPRNDAMDLLALTAEIVSAHVSNNQVDVDELPRLIQQVFATMASIEKKDFSITKERPEPAVPIHKSVKPGYIICLEDGKKLKMLKRHLKTAYNMTPEEYKDRWGLGGDYPMVAPDYAKQRSQLAKSIGLGTRTRKKK
ncbi:MAG: MucR family transcriptional regulator [Alphaproteobacteria bacterium]|nr:MucR family transcriptional regulator [Alphaproteobacteria bacterium]OJV47621.1 MAG: MucR family transcriptional regulator [Alphaproteobacteria bacterium 43-37]